ncbi:MAG: hypothetical protein AAFN92_15745, partial [Bacteroidota bacterium]
MKYFLASTLAVFFAVLPFISFAADASVDPSSLECEFEEANTLMTANCITINGDFDASNANVTMTFDILGASAAHTCSGSETYDQLIIQPGGGGSTGALDLTGGPMLTINVSGYSPTSMDEYVLITAAGGITGTFGNMDNMVSAGGIDYTIVYTATEVKLTLSPVEIEETTIIVCEGENTFTATFINFPIEPTAVTYDIEITLSDNTQQPGIGLQLNSFATVPANSDEAVVTFSASGFNFNSTLYDGGNVRINDVSTQPPNAMTVPFLFPDDTPINVSEIPDGIIDYASGQATTIC